MASGHQDTAFTATVRRLARIPPVVTVGVLVFVSVALTFDRLLLHLGTHLAGDADAAALSVWHVWWPQFGFGHAPDPLVIHAFSGGPFLTNHLRYMPIVYSVLYAWLGLLRNPVLAFNVLLVASVAATQVAAYVYLRKKDLPGPLALLGAAAFVLSPWYTKVVSGGNLIEVGLWLLPLALLVWDNWLGEPTMARAILVVLVAWAALWSGVQHVSWMLGLWLPYAVWSSRHVWRPEEPDRATEARDQLTAMGLVLAILVLAYPMPNIVRTLSGSEPAYAGVLEVDRANSQLASLVGASPAVWLAAGVTFAFGDNSRESRFWLVTGLLFLAFASGILPEPLRMLTGMFGLPYQPLYESSLFFAPAILALVVYVGLNWQDAWTGETRVARRGFSLAAVAVLILVGNLPILRSLHMVAFPSYAFYHSIASEPEDYYVLNYPFGLTSVQDGLSIGEGAYLSAYAVWHHKRTVGGIAPYYEPVVTETLRRMAFLYPAMLAPDELAGQSELLGRAVREWRIGCVVVHGDLLSEGEMDVIDALAEQSGALCPAVTREGLVIYRALWHPSGCGAI